MYPHVHSRNVKMIIDYCSGMIYKEIAVKYGLTPRQVQSRMEYMMKEYEAKHIGHLISILYQQNIL